MNNNNTNKTNQGARTKEDIRQGLFAMPVGLNMSGVQFTEKLSALCSKIETVFVRDIGMDQLIQVAIKPTTNRDGIVKAMEMKFYFDTTINSGTDAYIARGRSNGGYNNNNNSGEDSIYAYAGVNNTTQDGGFRPSTAFKQLISPFYMRSRNDKDNRIEIKQLPRQSHIATILMDDLSVISFLLGIQPNDPYETVINAAYPLENGYNGDVDDYILIFTKAITSPGHKKNRKSPIDCTKFDPSFNRNNRRENNDNRNNNREERTY